jgi:hypothetical protein
MEVDAIVEMFCSSVEKHRVKYVKYIGDGDTNTFKRILEIDPYDGDPLVQKIRERRTRPKKNGCKTTKSEKR